MASDDNPSSDGRTRKQRQMTGKGQEYAMEFLSKEVKRRNKKLTDQISLFEDLLKTNDVRLIKKELAKLDLMLHELEDASNRLLEVTKGDEKEQVDSKLKTEQESVSRLKAAVVEWLDAQGNDDQLDQTLSSKRNAEKSTTRLTID